VADAFIGPDEIEVGLDSGSISLASPTRAITLRQIAEPYPMLEAVRAFFRVEHPEHAIVKVADLAGPLKRAALMREKEGPVRVAFGPDLITINAKAKDLKQDGAEEVDAEYSGPAHEMAFNPKFFGDAISSAPGDVVDIAIDPSKYVAAVLTVPGNADWRHLLMPIRVEV